MTLFKQKKLLGWFMALAMIIFAFVMTGCSNNEEEPAANNLLLTESIYAVEETEVNNENNLANDLANNMPTNEPVFITWGWGLYTDGYRTLTPPNDKVGAHVAEEFGIVLDMHFVKHRNYTGADIYMGNAAEAYAEGVSRTIPREMIERYAPNYAGLLYSTNNGWEIFKVAGLESDEYICLNIFDETDYITRTSIYRLDWLENVGIMPNGTVWEAGDRIYITDTAFTQLQFMEIMEAFTFGNPNGDGTLNTKGFYLPDGEYHDWLLRMTEAIAGMFGLNDENVNEDGMAIPYYASEAYRSFLRFLSVLQFTGSVSVGYNYEWGTNGFYEGLAGYGYDNILNIPYLHGNSYSRVLFENNPSAKLLYAPPEIGDHQGMIFGSNFIFDLETQWIIDKDVTDEQLAVLLTLFDAINSDPELWLLVNYGVAGEDFYWDGEPFNSKIVQEINTSNIWQSRDKGIGLLNTFCRSDLTYKSVYEMGDIPPITASDGRGSLRNKPYKLDITGEYIEAKNILDGRYAEELGQVVQNFYNAVVNEEINVDSEWERYMTELYANGLQEYIDLIALYPVL